MKNVIYMQEWLDKKAQAEMNANLKIEYLKFKATYHREPSLRSYDPWERTLAEWIAGEAIAKQFNYWEEPTPDK